MKQRVRIHTLALVLFGFAISSSAAIPPERSKNCPPDPDTGWIVCGSTCVYPSKCQPLKNAPVGTYCRQATLVSGYPAGVCFTGDYDPCCDPNYQW